MSTSSQPSLSWELGPGSVGCSGPSGPGLIGRQMLLPSPIGVQIYPGGQMPSRVQSIRHLPPMQTVPSGHSASVQSIGIQAPGGSMQFSLMKQSLSPLQGLRQMPRIHSYPGGQPSSPQGPSGLPTGRQCPSKQIKFGGQDKSSSQILRHLPSIHSYPSGHSDVSVQLPFGSPPGSHTLSTQRNPGGQSRLPVQGFLQMPS